MQTRVLSLPFMSPLSCMALNGAPLWHFSSTSDQPLLKRRYINLGLQNYTSTETPVGIACKNEKLCDQTQLGQYHFEFTTFLRRFCEMLQTVVSPQNLQERAETV